MMLRVASRQLRATPVRFLLTALGVALAVSFTVSALVVGDGHRTGLQGLADRTLAGTDAAVAAPAGATADPEARTRLVEGLATIDGVAAAAASTEAVWNSVAIVVDGGAIETDGLPVIAGSWIDAETLNPFAVTEGGPPGPGQFVVDAEAARTHGLIVGQHYELTAPGRRVTAELVGTTSLGDGDQPGGADTLGAVFLHVADDEATSILGAEATTTLALALEPTADLGRVRAEILAAVPEATVTDRSTLVAQARDRYRDDFTRESAFVADLFLAFALVAVLVSVFLVVNTFAIALGQRTRELALLRMIGAGPAQIRRALIGEAAAIGLVASIIGLVGGLGVARGLEALFNATGDDMPTFPLTLRPRTVAVALVVGLGVPVLAVLRPAWRSSTVPALTALRGGPSRPTRASGRGRLRAGGALAGFGVLVGLFGLLAIDGTATIPALGGAAALLLVGVNLLAPTILPAVITVLAWPLGRIAGSPGRLAAGNAARNPGRSANTATTLAIGLAVATTALIVGQSVKTTFGQSIDEALTGDVMIAAGQDATFPLDLPERLSEDGIVEAAAGFRFAELRVDEEFVVTSAGADFDRLDRTYAVDITAGDLGPTVDHPVLILDDHARRTGLAIGDHQVIGDPEGSAVTATITGVYAGNAFFGTDLLVDRSVLDDSGDRTGPSWIVLALDPEATPEAVEAAMAGWRADFPAATVETTDELAARLDGLVDEALVVVNFLMALVIVIALVAIANTMALSMLERVREIGLVRAVGMSRRQVRRMVRYESALVAAFGATLGIGAGLLFGAVAVVALPDHYAATVGLPVTAIAVLAAVAVGCGVLASLLPARRAARLDVLDAISG